MKLRTGVGSVKETQKEYYTHPRNRAQSIHDPLDPPNNPFPSNRLVDRPFEFISAIESSASRLDKRHLSLVLWHSTFQQCKSARKVLRWRGFRTGGDGGLNGVRGVAGHRGRSFAKGRFVDFGKLDIGGIDAPVRIGVR